MSTKNCLSVPIQFRSIDTIHVHEIHPKYHETRSRALKQAKSLNLMTFRFPSRSQIFTAYLFSVLCRININPRAIFLCCTSVVTPPVILLLRRLVPCRHASSQLEEIPTCIFHSILWFSPHSHHSLDAVALQRQQDLPSGQQGLSYKVLQDRRVLIKPRSFHAQYGNSTLPKMAALAC